MWQSFNIYEIFASIHFRIHCHPKTVVLYVLFYGCEICCQHNGDYILMVFENRVLRILFGPKREEVREG